MIAVGYQHFNGSPDYFIVVVAKHPPRRRIHQHDLSFSIGQHDAFCSIFEKGSEVGGIDLHIIAIEGGKLHKCGKMMKNALTKRSDPLKGPFF